MNWQDYKKWLLENVLSWEEGQIQYSVSPLASQKYSLTSSTELEQSLNDFLDGVDRKSGDLTYYLLPEWKEGHTWEELFPERRETIFGSRKNKIPPSLEVWADLSRLYNYWGTENERTEKLREDAERLWAEMEQESKAIVISLISKTGDEKQFFSRYESWLAEYELLGGGVQKSLNGYKKLIQKDQNSLLEGLEKQKEWNKEIATVEEKIREKILSLKDWLLSLENQFQNKTNTWAIIISIISSVILMIAVILIYHYWLKDSLPLFRGPNNN
jgi:hypothetical protein